MKKILCILCLLVGIFVYNTSAEAYYYRPYRYHAFSRHYRRPYRRHYYYRPVRYSYGYRYNRRWYW